MIVNLENFQAIVIKKKNAKIKDISLLNATGRIQKLIGFKEKEVLLNNFAYSSFNY